MTREEEIVLASKQHKNSLFSNYGDAFIVGARWADEHPKSLWISAEEDLPFKHKELLCEYKGFIHPSTKLALIRTEENMYNISFMYNDGQGWKWNFHLDKITHWMPIPEIINHSML